MDHKNIPAIDIRTYWILEVAKRNILTSDYHIVSLPHTEKEINILLSKYDFNDIKEFCQR
jgi:hypothetical protein